jgi:predicted nucleotidyltransferase
MRDNRGRDRTMDTSAVVAKLREHAPELNAAGILHLGVHGSVARGDATSSSDVDLIAEFDQAKRLSLIGRVHLENRLTDILGVKADLADKALLRPEVLERAQRESVLVF